MQQALWLWPALTLPLLLVPTARRRILARPTSSWGPWPSVALGLACMLMVLLVYRGYMVNYPLPPSGAPYYPDLMWHMGLIHEATRSVPLLTPQSVADGTLRYHWFSNAHIAASTLMTGTDVAVAFLRLWILPVVVLVVLLTAVLAHRVSGRPWVGALAGWLVVPTLGYTFWPGMVNPSNHLSPLSPSQVFSTALALLLVITLADLVRTKVGPEPPRSSSRSSPRWRPAAARALPSRSYSVVWAPPSWPPWSSGATVSCCSGPVSSWPFWLPSHWRSWQVATPGRASNSFRPCPSLRPTARSSRAGPTSAPACSTDSFTRRAGPVLLVALLLIVVLTYGRLLAGFIPFFQRALRTDLAAWLLAGLCLTPFIPFFVIAHSGYSQYYFLFGAIPFGSALWAWSIGELIGTRARGRGRLRPPSPSWVC